MEQQQIQARAIVRNIGQLVSVAQAPIAGASGLLQVLSNAAIMVDNDGNISWIGADQEVDEMLACSEQGHVNIVDAYGCVVTPGFVDSHTHLVFAGDRAEEFHLRREGTSYGELLRQGRGILTTMNATRHASSEMLLDLAMERLASVRAHGTTTVEIKTGYGLNLEAEERCLRIINDLNCSPSLPHEHVRIIPTFLGAHSVPPEYHGRRAAYVDLVVEEMLPAFAELARFCDVYCEREAFSVAESHRILTRAKELGYQLKVHADQLSPSGGSQLAAELGAVSADHLDYASDTDLEAMREAGVVATLLPGCSYTLRSPYPSARRLLDHGLKVALASDFNPGTSYSENMQMMLGLAMSAMGMSLDEALSAATINGARALALQDETGSIEIGKRCELALWSIRDYHEIGYHFGTNLIQSILVL
ncbi:imidazolonepropionase [Dictyobacter kobayashii]|uniref:Imidazolonepropionase n=1 Tax=Dictyobacter kobayashii TaxID=2014872 RepID=A0A402ANY9_9CHLR|nr:imidazolonepropionase [Dictyobacter kobayashii]GCE20744.1 imidazolonepropionase [Dictyobacter kobayashii]